MTGLRERWFPPLSAEERERRLQLFRLLLIVQVIAAIVLAGAASVDTWQTPRYMVITLIVCAAVILVSVAAYLLAGRGAFYLGALLLVIALVGSLGYFIALYGTRSTLPFLLIWPIMVVAVLLESPLVLLTTTIVALLYGGLSLIELYQVWPLPFHSPELFAHWHRPGDPEILRRVLSDTADVIVVYCAAAFLTRISSHRLQQELRRSRSQAAELARYRSELEEMVTTRTAELSEAMASLQASLQNIREIGSPVLPIFEGIMLTSLVGTIDTERARLVMERVLQEVAQARARAVIMDITAVSVVDTAVANALIQTAQGIRLLGGTPILVGVRSEVAETMVELGVELKGIVTRASLQAGLEYALRTMGVQLVEEEGHASRRDALARLRSRTERSRGPA